MTLFLGGKNIKQRLVLRLHSPVTPLLKVTFFSNLKSAFAASHLLSKSTGGKQSLGNRIKPDFSFRLSVGAGSTTE